MKVIIQWSTEEDGERIILDKLWKFTTDNFSGEIPCVGDRMLLKLPIENPLETDRHPSKSHQLWKFQVVQRTWEPENSTIHLKVRLDNPQEFLDLSEEEKDSFQDRLKEEWHDRGSRRPKLSLETVRVNVSQTNDEQETQGLENSTPQSYQEEKSHQESEAKTQIRDLEITDTIVHSRKRRQLDVHGTIFTQIHQQGC